MAACKAVTLAAHNIPFSSVVTTMARNGTELFGIRVSGLGDRWYVGPSQKVKGLYFSGYSEEDANPDIGDSTISETAGIGAFAMATAPAIVQFIGGTPDDALQYNSGDVRITVTEDSQYQLPPLSFRGTPTGIDIRQVVRQNLLPIYAPALLIVCLVLARWALVLCAHQWSALYLLCAELAKTFRMKHSKLLLLS